MEPFKLISFFDKVKIGDIITVDGDNFFDKVISWVTSSKEDHDCVFIGEGQVLEAQNFVGVRVFPVIEYLNDPTKTVYISRVKDATADQVKLVVEKGKHLIGVKYDMIGLVGILAKYLVRKAGLGWFITFFGENRIHNAEQLWCSELTALLWERAGIKLVDEDMSYVTPSEIFASDKVFTVEY